MSKARVIFTSYVTHYAIFSNICHLVVSHTRNTTAQQIGVPEVEQGIAWVERRLFLARASKSKHRFRYFERGGIVVGHVPGHIGVESVYEWKLRQERVPLQLSLQKWLEENSAYTHGDRDSEEWRGQDACPPIEERRPQRIWCV